MERISEIIPQAEYHQIQHFISESPWDYTLATEQVSVEVSEILQQEKECKNDKIGLIIDETGMEKKGTKSVGVARQYNGNLGKVDNCQVMVCAGLSLKKRYSLVDFELFLPQEWTSDKSRMTVAKVPLERQEKGYQTKPELALELIKRQLKLGVKFDYIAADALYGNSPKFLKSLDDLNQLFVIDIHSNQEIYLEKPSIIQQENKGVKIITKLISTENPIKVNAFIKTLKESDFEEVELRKGTKGAIKCLGFQQKIYTYDKKTHQISERILLIKKTQNKDDSFEIKYIFSNANWGEFTLEELLKMQAQRYFIERSFQEIKQDLGCADYQVRGWLAFHHHVSLCLLAQLFILKEKILFKEELPQLSAYDVREIMVRTYATKYQEDEQEVYRQMNKRHRQRANAENFFYDKT